MNFPDLKKPVMGLLGAISLVSLTACDALATSIGDGADSEVSAADLEPILANPEVGDLWAAKLDEFSAQPFNDEDDMDADAFGLLKVIEVSDDSVTVITENAAWPMASGTIEELGGDLASIIWDETEEISIDRSDFANLVSQGHILKTRRLDN